MAKFAGTGGGLEGTIKTVDLPAAGSPPSTVAEIDLSDKPTVTLVNIVIFGEAYMAYAADSATVKSNLGSDSTRQRLAGNAAYSIPVGSNAGVLAFTSASTAVTDGLSYHLVET
ncbi:MAG: hypothetical protein DRI56_03240 [Chloroflexota bacterium]|nr:MAG: hypothetical protein DRI56_03240 [Chloroflexota bacterium]